MGANEPEHDEDGDYGEEEHDAERDMIRENASHHEEIGGRQGLGGIVSAAQKVGSAIEIIGMKPGAVLPSPEVIKKCLTYTDIAIRV